MKYSHGSTLANTLKSSIMVTRTVTEVDNVFFTCLTLNPSLIHLYHEPSEGNSSALSSGAGTVTFVAGKPLFNCMVSSSIPC